MTSYDDEQLMSSSAVAKRLGVSRLTVVAMGEDGRLPRPLLRTAAGRRFWRTEEIERGIAEGWLPGPRRQPTPRAPSPESLARQYAIRRRFVEAERLLSRRELAQEFGVHRSLVYGALRGEKLGKGRYDRLRDDELQPEIDERWARTWTP